MGCERLANGAAACRALQVNISDADAKERFKKFDTDGNGDLSKEEFKEVRRATASCGFWTSPR